MSLSWPRRPLRLAAKPSGERQEDAGTADAAERSAAQAAALVRFNGIGQNGAVPLCREVFYRHFNNRRELGGYIGLAPSPYNSGSMRVDQGISKAGNPRARTLARSPGYGSATAAASVSPITVQILSS